MAETLKEKTAKGLFWGGLNNGFQQVLNLVFGIFLARMLSQSDYGMVGMLLVFSQLAGALQEGGFISALNRKKNISHNDYNSVFWFSTLVSFLLYVTLFLSAPLIAQFYGIPELTPLARFIFLAFFISSLGIAPGAFMFRNMMVREAAFITIMCNFISGVVAICLAANGFAYWGIAIQTVLFVIIVVALRFYYSQWHPTLPIDFSPIREMFRYSCKLIITSIFNIINGNLFSVILGKMYTPREVGNYSQANKWNNMGSSLIGGMLGSVAQPIFAKTDGDKNRQKRVFRKLLRFTAFVSFPAMFGLALVAKEFIVILLTEKWMESARMMQMLCIAGAFAPISGLFSNLIITRGHSTTYMWCTISFCLTQLLAVFLSTPYGIDCMILTYVFISICWIFVWYHFSYKEIDLHLFEVVKDISPYLFLSALFVLLTYYLTIDISNLYIKFFSKVFIVASSYCVSLWLLKSTIFKEIILFITTKEISS